MATLNTSVSGSPPKEADPLASVPSLPALDNTFGAMLLGTFVGLILYGLTVHQSYRYIRLYPHDRLVLKLLVFVLFLLETSHVIFCIHMCYFYFIQNYFSPAALLVGVWSLKNLPITTAIVIFVCHGFYARRIYYLVKHRYRFIVAPVLFFMIGELAFVIAAMIEEYRLVTFARWQSKTWLISAGFGNAVVADVLLTTTLIVILRRSRTGIKQTDSIIDILVLYTINTGFLTGLFSFLSFMFALVQPDNMIYIGLNMVSTRTYANSVLAVLNSRRSLNERSSKTALEAGTFGLDSLGSGIVVSTRNDPRRVESNTQAREGTSVVIIKGSRITGSTSSHLTEMTSNQEFEMKEPSCYV